jgi:hypothetical protein
MGFRPDTLYQNARSAHVTPSKTVAEPRHHSKSFDSFFNIALGGKGGVSNERTPPAYRPSLYPFSLNLPPPPRGGPQASHKRFSQTPQTASRPPR